MAAASKPEQARQGRPPAGRTGGGASHGAAPAAAVGRAGSGALATRRRRLQRGSDGPRARAACCGLCARVACRLGAQPSSPSRLPRFRRRLRLRRRRRATPPPHCHKLKHEEEGSCWC